MVGRLLLACYSLTALWQHFSRTTASLLATPTNDVSFNGPEASGNPEEMSGSVVVTEAEGLNLAADSISDNFGEELDPAVEEEEEWNTADMAAKKDDLSALKKIAESSYAKLFEIITEAEGLISDDFGEELDPAVEEEEEWNTAAMAAKSGDLSALKKIGESSWAQLFETDENLWQPIHEAARYGHFEVVDYLLAEGADINAHTSMDHTPLDVAIEYLGESHPIVKKLRDVGAVSGIIEHTDVADEYYAADEYYDEL